ncbi:MAG: hypothetical protein AAF226_16620, partial [Verrucomicrobiota bacterium]
GYDRGMKGEIIVLSVIAFVFLTLRWAKGSWGNALIGTLVAPLALVPLFGVTLIAMTLLTVPIGAFFSFSNDTAHAFSLSGTWAVTIGLYVLYCIRNREVHDVELVGYLPTSSGSKMTANHALKRDFSLKS